eukprot:UN18479
MYLIRYVSYILCSIFVPQTLCTRCTW